MAIDPNWVRENPEEAARQLDLLGKKYDALMSAKLEALPADLKSRFVIVKMTGDIDRETVHKIGKELRKYTAGNAVFINMPVDIETIDMTNRDALVKAKALFDMSERLEAYDQPIAANQCWNEGDKLRRQAEGGA